jgi:hypothetical protein
MKMCANGPPANQAANETIPPTTKSTPLTVNTITEPIISTILKFKAWTTFISERDYIALRSIKYDLNKTFSVIATPEMAREMRNLAPNSPLTFNGASASTAANNWRSSRHGFTYKFATIFVHRYTDTTRIVYNERSQGVLQVIAIFNNHAQYSAYLDDLEIRWQTYCSSHC